MVATTTTEGYATTDCEADATLQNGDEILHGTMARIESDRGLFADPIPEEYREDFLASVEPILDELLQTKRTKLAALSAE